jgi:hypothetical protein
MTPEHAEEIASRIRANYALGTIARDAIKQAILQACAEQREEDARICRTRGDKSGDDYEAGGCYGCEIAIREGK